MPNEVKANAELKSTLRYPFNVNYARWFNSQAVEFLSGTPANADAELRDGFVTVSGSTQVFERPKDGGKTFPEFRRDGGELVVGCYWTAKEKEKFFQYLGRKSRHNLAAVAEAIGTKSVVEVQEYHDVLCQAAANAKDGLSMEDMPAAREMSESWIAVEEHQGGSIMAWEDDKELHRVKMQEWRKKDGEMSQIEGSEGLLNSTELLAMASRVYFNSRLDPEEELDDRPMVTDLSREFVHEFEEHIKDCVRVLVKKSILTFLNRNKTGAADNGGAVSEEDAREAIKLLRFPKHSRLYWMDVCKRLNIGLRKDDRSIPSDEYVKNYLRPVWGRKATLRKIDPKLLPYYNFQAENRTRRKRRKLNEAIDFSDAENIDSDYSFNDLMVYSDDDTMDAATNWHGTNDYGYSTDEDYEDSADEEAQAQKEELELIAEEEVYLDMLDAKASRYEEHLLLTWMTTFQSSLVHQLDEQSDNEGDDEDPDNSEKDSNSGEVKRDQDSLVNHQPSLRLKKWLRAFPRSGFSI